MEFRDTAGDTLLTNRLVAGENVEFEQVVGSSEVKVNAAFGEGFNAGILAGARIWDLRLERFAGGIPLDGSDCKAAVLAAIADPDVQRVYWPEGEFFYEGENIKILDGLHIEGAGAERCFLTYTPPLDEDPVSYPRRGAITFSGASFGSVKGMSIKHTGSRCVDRQREPGVGLSTAIHGYGVEIFNSNDIEVSYCELVEGLHGVYVHSDDPEFESYWSANKNVKVHNNNFYGQYNAGVYIYHAYAPSVRHNWCQGQGYDGIKATGWNFMIDVCFNSCSETGRDGIDCYPAGRGSKIDYNRCWDCSGFAIEAKGLHDVSIGQLDYGLRDGSVSGNRGWNCGIGGSWSIDAGTPQPTFAFTEIRGMIIDGNIAIEGTGEGGRFTNCQGCTISNFKVIRPARQGLSFYGTSRCLIVAPDIEDAGYVEGLASTAPGTFDAMTFAFGSSLNVVMAGAGNNSTFKPGQTRYFATFDASSTINVFRDALIYSTLSGRFATGTSTQESNGSVTITGPFDTTDPFSSQAITSYLDTAYRGARMLSTSRAGIAVTGSNAEWSVKRTGAVELVAQAQAALAYLFTVGNFELQFGTNSNPRFKINTAGHFVSSSDGLYDIGATGNLIRDIKLSGKVVINGITIITGSGSPEGVVTASPSSLYLRTDSGLVYRKASGTGNTGWTAMT